MTQIQLGQWRTENVWIFRQKFDVVVGKSTTTQAQVSKFGLNILEEVGKLVGDDTVWQIKTLQLENRKEMLTIQ